MSKIPYEWPDSDYYRKSLTGKIYYPLDLTFVLIEKNCSNSLAKFSGKDWSKSGTDGGPGRIRLSEECTDNLVVILRNPMERFISALNMYLQFTSNFNAIRRSSNQEHDIFHTMDTHFSPQAHRISHLDHSKIDFFYQTSDTLGDIFRHYSIPETSRRLNSRGKKNKIVKKVDAALIREKYHMDYELIKNTKFINV